MDSRQIILDKIKQHTTSRAPKPEMAFQPITYPDKMARFIEISKAVGGDAVELQPGQDVNEVIRAAYPEAQRIVSDLPYINIATYRPDDVEKPGDMNGTDLAIVEGEIGVCENGCVWVDQTMEQRAMYFISEYLVIILDKSKLVHNMHEAYKRVEEIGPTSRYSCFISGPSKTADIEQALVIGAHGARGALVILK
ncbi:LutC/YkgG family protein [Porphyromonas loveana]|uniref:L-lactate dehydrogenase complex protein LldG n=4 Tax=Porphyromonas loveana TaxID=1884669 RepID=A0A2U1FL88_9PORP|nr:LUD domain-containing protein [Porphyromonas loveana]PVZ12790.1 L-lactate dehydrogenase complex protein LldG [Porphyromonas loveana]